MIYYSKITAINLKENVYELFIAHGAKEHDIILDSSPTQKQPGSVFLGVKQRIVETRDRLVIDSLRSLGKNNREIAKELHWFYEHNVPLIVLDLPATADGSTISIQLLSEVYDKLAAIEIQNAKAMQAEGISRLRQEKRPLGRKRIPYPPNWEEAYNQWCRKEINATQFMKLTGLKKGTLYNLIKQYKAQEAIGKEA